MINLKKTVSRTLVSFAVACAASSVAFAGTITKSPDLGPYWSPLSSSGSYIYADSFVADVSGSVTSLGTWLLNGSSNLLFQVYGSIGGNAAAGPDSSNIFATTGTVTGQTYDSLTFVDGGLVTDIADLIAGQTYWFGASTVGQGGSGGYTVGGHTQNTGGIVDGGSFWYSNDPVGQSFDGRGLTPEIAFRVGIAESSNVPEPASIALLGLGMLGFVASRRKSTK